MELSQRWNLPDFGMNLRHGLEDSPPYVSWVILSLGILLGFVTRAILARRPDAE